MHERLRGVTRGPRGYKLYLARMCAAFRSKEEMLRLVIEGCDWHMVSIPSFVGVDSSLA